MGNFVPYQDCFAITTGNGFARFAVYNFFNRLHCYQNGMITCQALTTHY